MLDVGYSCRNVELHWFSVTSDFSIPKLWLSSKLVQNRGDPSFARGLITATFGEVGHANLKEDDKGLMQNKRKSYRLDNENKLSRLGLLRSSYRYGTKERSSKSLKRQMSVIPTGV